MHAISMPSDGNNWGLMDPTFSFSNDSTSPLNSIVCGRRNEYPLDELEMVYSPENPEDIHTMHFEINQIEDQDDDFPDDPVLYSIRANLSIFPKCVVTDPLGDQHFIYKCYSFSRPIYYLISDDIVTVTRNHPVFPAGSTCADFDVSLLLDHRPSFVEATYLLSFSPVDTMMIFGGRYDVVGKFFMYSQGFWQSVKNHLLDITEEADRRKQAEIRFFNYADQAFNMV